MRDPENIKELVKTSPDFIGFIFYEKSPRFVADDVAEQIVKTIPKEIKKTGVFVNASADEINAKIKRFQLDAIQFHGSETPDFIAQFQESNCIRIKAFGVDETFDFTETDIYESVCDYFLFDTKTKQHGGSGKRFNSDLLEDYKGKTPFLLSGGIDEEILNEWNKIQHPQLAGLDVNSRFETTPGIKDIHRLEEFNRRLSLSGRGCAASVGEER